MRERVGTSRSGIWVVTGMTRSVGPGQHHRDQVAGDAAALGDELGLAGMGEADRIELRLGDRPGDERRGGAGAGQPDRELERVERVARAVAGRAGRATSVASATLMHRQRAVEATDRLGRIVDDRDRPVPDRLDRRRAADREEGRQGFGAPPLPALGDDLGPDPRRVAQRDGERSCRSPPQR